MVHRLDDSYIKRLQFRTSAFACLTIVCVLAAVLEAIVIDADFAIRMSLMLAAFVFWKVTAHFADKTMQSRKELDHLTTNN